MDSDSQPGRGRPRDARADASILRAVLGLIADHGAEHLRIDDVAARAGVGKATIYRRYRSRDALLTAAVAAVVGDIAIPDTGSTRDDLLALMRDAVAVYAGPPASRAMPELVAAMNRDAGVGRATREGFLAPRRAALRSVLERGVERGDLRPDLDTELALDVLGGPLFYRLLITGGPIDEGLAAGVVELILRGFAAGARSRPVRPRRRSRPP